MSLATWITLARFPLLIAIILMLYWGDAVVQLVTAPLILILILMDAVDGIIARQRNEVTLLGSVLDIAVDRAVELVFWVVFAQLGLISMVIPIVFIIRGTLTDSVREVGYSHGESAHAQMSTRWGQWLVAGRPMRAGYGAAKLAAFMLLAVTLGLRSAASPFYDAVWLAAQIASWISLVLCILRGAPVIYEAFRWERGNQVRG
jgi:CDP-diacylglycerol--glycerol-3-phosphate 3-phosphatidyltransferase